MLLEGARGLRNPRIGGPTFATVCGSELGFTILPLEPAQLQVCSACYDKLEEEWPVDEETGQEEQYCLMCEAPPLA